MKPIRVFHREREVLVGNSLTMTLSDDLTYSLWKQFKSENKVFLSGYTGCYYSVQEFPEGFTGGLQEPFSKWAAIKTETMIGTMNSIIIHEGLYAEFEHIGTPETLGITMAKIFTQWLPKSKFQLDNRPHLAIMKNNYSTSDPKAIETILIPIISL